MIFPALIIEETVQENDRTRLDGSGSFVSPDEAAITLVEIQPEASESFIDVTSKRYLDWRYAVPGVKTVVVRVTTDGAPTTFSKDLTVISQADDKLFSTDQELVVHEFDILEYVQEGRDSFLNIHRRAQEIILAYLDERRIHGINGEALTKDAIINIEEVNEWSKFVTLRLIFEARSNAVDDIFSEKVKKYMLMEEKARNRGVIRLDRNGDGDEDPGGTDTRAYVLVRR